MLFLVLLAALMVSALPAADVTFGLFLRFSHHSRVLWYGPLLDCTCTFVGHANYRGQCAHFSWCHEGQYEVDYSGPWLLLQSCDSILRAIMVPLEGVGGWLSAYCRLFQFKGMKPATMVLGEGLSATSAKMVASDSPRLFGRTCVDSEMAMVHLCFATLRRGEDYAWLVLGHAWKSDVLMTALCQCLCFCSFLVSLVQRTFGHCRACWFRPCESKVPLGKPWYAFGDCFQIRSNEQLLHECPFSFGCDFPACSYSLGVSDLP